MDANGDDVAAVLPTQTIGDISKPVLQIAPMFLLIGTLAAASFACWRAAKNARSMPQALVVTLIGFLIFPLLNVFTGFSVFGSLPVDTSNDSYVYLTGVLWQETVIDLLPFVYLLGIVVFGGNAMRRRMQGGL